VHRHIQSWLPITRHIVCLFYVRLSAYPNYHQSQEPRRPPRRKQPRACLQLLEVQIPMQLHRLLPWPLDAAMWHNPSCREMVPVASKRACLQRTKLLRAFAKHATLLAAKVAALVIPTTAGRIQSSSAAKTPTTLTWPPSLAARAIRSAAPLLAGGQLAGVVVQTCALNAPMHTLANIA